MSREVHKWGESPGADAVRELVVGLAPSQMGRRIMAVFKAFIDESVKGDHFVLAGHVASEKAWEAFSRDWERTLPLGLRDADGYYFHMTEMAATPERMQRVPAFYRIMEDHVLFSVSVHFKLSEFNAARRRIYIPGVNLRWKEWGQPHFTAFRAILDRFHIEKETFAQFGLPIDQPVDFIFDEHSIKRPFDAAWDEYISGRPPDIKERFGQHPIFRNDREFLPLQAADLWAWWVREWYATGDPIGDHINLPDFGKWKARPGHVKQVWHLQEDHMARYYMRIGAGMVPPSGWIYDLRPGRGIAAARGRKVI